MWTIVQRPAGAGSRITRRFRPTISAPEAGLAQPRREAARGGAAGEPASAEVEFQVQWIGWDGDAPRTLSPFTVPDERSALICVQAMPGPILSATAYRIQRDPVFGETRTVIAYRRNPACSTEPWGAE